MKTIFTLALACLASLSVMGQKKTTAPPTEQKEKPAKTQPTQQSAKSAPAQQKDVSTKEVVKEDKKPTNSDEDKKKHPKDTVVHKGNKAKYYNETRKNQQDPVEEWKCPKCGRKFGSLNKEGVPKDHLCPYDHTKLKRTR